MYSVIVDWANRDFDLSLFVLWKFLHPTHPPGEQLFSSKLCIAERCTVRRFWYLSLWRGCLLEESLGTRRRPLVYSFDCWNREARLRTIYLACFILQLIIIRKAGGGDLRPHPPPYDRGASYWASSSAVAILVTTGSLPWKSNRTGKVNI